MGNADDITLLAVVNAVEPVQRNCALKLPSHADHLCALHQALDDTMASVEGALGKLRIGELLRQKKDVRPLCAHQLPASLNNRFPAPAEGAVLGEAHAPSC